MEHTKTPWECVVTNSRCDIRACNDEVKDEIMLLADNHSETEHDTTAANFAYIVKCVNSHESLIAALNRIAIMPDNMIETARTVARTALASCK